jgi:outer membrane protein
MSAHVIIAMGMLHISFRQLRAFFTATLLALFMLGNTSTAKAEMKVAVIDLRRAVADTEDGLRMKGRLQELHDVRQAEYSLKEKRVAKAKAELEKLARAGKTSQAELRKKYAVLEKKAVELQSAGVAFRREMQKAENQMMYPILKKLNLLVRRLAAKEGFDVVLNREAVPYFRSDLDITERVIGLYNASSPKKDEPKGKGKGKTKGKRKNS